MHIQMIDNVERNMASALVSAIKSAFDIRIAVAFVSSDGLSCLMPSIKEVIERGSHIEFLVGMDPRATDPNAIKELYSLLRDYSQGVLLCFVPRDSSAIYHPKMYLTKNYQFAQLFIGSSNLTQRGLIKNIEANLVIRDEINTEIVSEVYNTYYRLKYHPNRVIPDEEFLDLFSELCQKEKFYQSRLVKNQTLRQLKQNFIEKAKSLERPKPTRTDLIGWLELVYNSLPQGEFTNQEIYRFEPQFRQRYPENQNIKAKIRQQLQILHQLGFIKHVNRGTWKKVA
ncbi:MAG: phospholipase D-like domain-containing protein [Bellilinea sp.]|nr:phospholipase D-like domain-containing protein [Bellilinea sp.]